MKSIIVHTLVKNEARWLWYSVSSVVEHVDKVLLWDTGSTDGSREIEKELVGKWPGKIILKERLQETAEEFPVVRQEMLDETASDWFLLVDADEIWWENSIKKVINLINERGNELESIAVPNILPVGDIFHRQEEKAGKYKIAGRTGHYNLRAVKRSISGLRSEGVHGIWGYVDKGGKKIQERGPAKVGFVDAPYMHMTHLERAGGGKDSDVIKRKAKFVYEIGRNFPLDFYYPEAFFRERPDILPSPWKTMDMKFKFVSYIETPLRKIKRRVWKGKVGY